MEGDASTDSSNSDIYSHLEKCLRLYVKSLRDKPGNCRRLKKAFPELYAENPEALTLLSEEFGQKYTSSLEKSIKELLESSEMKLKIGELEKLTENSDFSWRPSGDAEKDMRAHITLLEQNELISVEQDIDKEMEKQAQLREIFAQKENLIQQRLLHANAAVEDLTSAAKIILDSKELMNSHDDR